MCRHFHFEIRSEVPFQYQNDDKLIIRIIQDKDYIKSTCARKLQIHINICNKHTFKCILRIFKNNHITFRSL